MIVYLSMLETEAERDLFQKLYEENRQKLYFIAWKILRNETDAEDAVHTCFLKMADKFARYSHLPYVELVWLCEAVTQNAATDIAREYEKKRNFENETYRNGEGVPDISPDVLDELINRYDQSLVVQAIMQLTEEEKQFLYLQYGMGIKPKNIGELMDMPSADVRKKMFGCRKKVAKILEGDEYEGLR